MSEKIKFNILKHAGDPTHYTAGQTIFRKGDPGETMFVVSKGKVDIVVEGKVVDHLTEGEIFGEMSLIDKHARSADAVANGDCSLIAIDEKRFLYMTHQAPLFALQVMRMVAARLRERMADLERLRRE